MIVVWVRGGSLKARGGHGQRKDAEAARSDFECQAGLALERYPSRVNGRS